MKEIEVQRVVDLTCDVFGKCREPLHLKNDDATRAKLLNAADKFFDMWEDSLMISIGHSTNFLVVHCYTHAGNEAVNPGRLHAQYGWLAAYFQDCLWEG